MEKPFNQINMNMFNSGVTLANVGYLNRHFIFFFKVTPAQQRSETHEDLTNNTKKISLLGLERRRLTTAFVNQLNVSRSRFSGKRSLQEY